jgi:SPP1 gp7 family putative phage head morphogenesis protein
MQNESITTQLARLSLKATIDLNRYEANARRTTLAEFKKLELELVALINVAPTVRLNSLLRQVRETVEKYTGPIAAIRAADDLTIAELEAIATINGINGVVGASVASARITDNFLSSVMDHSLVQGAPSSEWWARQSVSIQRRFMDIVRPGLLQGTSTNKMTADFRDAMGIERKHSEALVRTSVQQVANMARMRVYEDNADIMKGYQTLITFDTRTSPLCRGRSGFAWDLEGKPLNNDLPFPGAPPWHMNCRTVLVGIMKSWEELSGKKQEEIPPGTRSSMDGQVSAELTYDDFFGGLTEFEQAKVLGPTKLRLYKKNKLKFSDMVDQSGNELTIIQLERKIRRAA